MVKIQMTVMAGAMFFLCGCTSAQLRRSSVKYARSVSDLHTEQILDNLAKFSANPNALPHFSYPISGSTTIVDGVAATPGFNFSPRNLIGWGLNLNASRSDQESFTMQPINDPRKLELMKCAYQRAVSGACSCGESGHCPNCEYKFNSFYLGETHPSMTPKQTQDGKSILAYYQNEGDSDYLEVVAEKNEFNETVYLYWADGQPAPKPTNPKQLKQLYVPNSVTEFTNHSGEVTVECISSGWIRCCEKSHLKDLNPCCLIGEHCGHYVYVPNCHRDELTKLTLVVLDIALNEPAILPPGPTKTVKALLNSQGVIAAEEDKGVYEVTQIVPASTSLGAIAAPRANETNVMGVPASAFPLNLSPTSPEVKRVVPFHQRTQPLGSEIQILRQQIQSQTPGL